MDFEKLKHVDDNTRDIVSGYVRNNKVGSLPPLIFHCILAFYWIKEYFERIGLNIKVSDDNSTIQMQADHHSTIYGIASYGSLIIPSQNNECIYKWKLKLTEYSGYRSLLIGITWTWNDHEDVDHILAYDAYSVVNIVGRGLIVLSHQPWKHVDRRRLASGQRLV